MKDKVNNQDYSFVNFSDLDIKEQKLVWGWRNADEIRKWMYTSEIIPFENHLHFIQALKDSRTKLYYLVKRAGTPIGVFSMVDISDKEGEWGYYIAPEYHERSLGVEFYYYILNFIFESLHFQKINGYALIANKAANSLNDLFHFGKESGEKKEVGDKKNYNLRTLNQDDWHQKVKSDKRIMRLLELTLQRKI